MNRYGLKVTLCMVAWLIWIEGFVVKWGPLKEVNDYVYILPTSAIASSGYPMSTMMARSLGWWIEPNELLKST